MRPSPAVNGGRRGRTGPNRKRRTGTPIRAAVRHAAYSRGGRAGQSTPVESATGPRNAPADRARPERNFRGGGRFLVDPAADWRYVLQGSLKRRFTTICSPFLTSRPGEIPA